MKFKRQTIALVTAALLSACGGSDGGTSAPEIKEIAPQVELSGTNRAQEKTQVVIKSTVEDYDGQVVSYQWTSSSTDIQFNNPSEAHASFIAPSVEQDTSYDITLTVTDDDGLQTAVTQQFKSERIFKEISLFGRVYLDNISYASVVVTVGDEVFSFGGEGEERATDSQGNYFLNLNVDERNVDKPIKITASVNPDYNNKQIKLVSLLRSVNSLLELFHVNNTIGYSEDFAVNVTLMSTAKYMAAIELNGGNEIIDDEQYQAAYSQLALTEDNIELIEYAMALTAFVEGQNPQLTDVYEDVLQFAYDSEQVIAYIAVLKQDQELYERLRVENLRDFYLNPYPDYDGDYIADRNDDDQDNDGVLNWVIDENGKKDKINFFPKDFAPKDETIVSPTLEQLGEYLNTKYSDDDQSNYLTLFNCVSYAIDLIDPYYGKELPDGVLTGSQRIRLNELSDLKCSSKIGFIMELSYLSNLETLNIAEVGSKDFSWLVNLPNLKSFTYVPSEISTNVDMSGLTSLTKLETLVIDKVQFLDYDLFANLTSLTSASITNTTLTTTEPFINNTALTHLNLSQNSISDASHLSGLHNLQELDLHSNFVINLPDTSNLNVLSKLALEHNHISDISPLKASNLIRELNLSDNRLELDSLLDLPNYLNLETLNISHNDLSSLAGVGKLTSLKSLASEDNPLIDISGLQNLVNLTYLHISGSPETSTTISDLTVLSGLTKLEHLNLAYNSIESASTVTVLVNLKTLNLADNLIEVTEGLSTFSNLESIDLSGNNIKNTGFLSNYQVSGTINLSNNLIENITGLISLKVLPEILVLGDTNANCNEITLLEQNIPEASIFSWASCWDFDLNKRVFNNQELVDYTIDDMFLSEIFKFNDLDSGGRGSSAVVGRPLTFYWPKFGKEYTYNERYLCNYNEARLVAPICYAVIGDLLGLTCNAEIGDAVVQCGFSSADLTGIAPITVDYSLNYSFFDHLNRNFKADFNNRNLLHLLRVHFDEVDLTCNDSDEDGIFDCLFKSDFFAGDISWQQNHSYWSMPVCRGEQGSTVARCTPTDALFENDAPLGTDNEFSFDVDLNIHKSVERKAGELPPRPGAD